MNYAATVIEGTSETIVCCQKGPISRSHLEQEEKFVTSL